MALSDKGGKEVGLGKHTQGHATVSIMFYLFIYLFLKFISFERESVCPLTSRAEVKRGRENPMQGSTSQTKLKSDT